MSDRDRSPRRAMCAAILSLEALTLALTTPVLLVLSDVSTGVGLGIGLGLAAAAVLVAGLLRAEWAYYLGWALQVAAIALGIVIGFMYLLGGLFALLWATAYLLGRKIERERTAAYTRFDAQQG